MTLTSTPDVVDFYCGMGGSSTGLQRAGFQVKAAVNHWDRAIETHSANHPDTDHWCVDVSTLEMRRLPKARVLWASPICTEISPAGGRRRRPRQDALLDDETYVPGAGFEKTRVTFWEVIRAAEYWRYDLVLLENVTEAVDDWELFDVWLSGMNVLGYECQFVSVNAAHVGDEPAPQWRDRVYLVLTRKGMRKPDVQPRPVAWCEKCGRDVESIQWWKDPTRRVGKYGRQYWYVCPEGAHGIVEPYVRPAAAAIDWSNVGTRIGDRKKSLAKGTMARIQLGVDMINSGSLMFTMAHGSPGAHVDPMVTPMRTWTTKATEGIMTLPSVGEDSSFLAMLRNNAKPIPVHRDAAPTFTAGGFHHGLVIPYRKGARPYVAQEGPLSTMATRHQHGVMRPAVAIEDCHFRMLTPREAANAQSFPREYVIHGNSAERQMQAGNAVAVNVAEWIGTRSLEVL